MSGGGEEIAKYEAWIREIESRQRELAKNRGAYLRFFVGFMVVSAVGFAWGPMLGAATLFSGIVFCVFGFYVVSVRGSDYVRELTLARIAVERLRKRQGVVTLAPSEEQNATK